MTYRAIDLIESLESCELQGQSRMLDVRGRTEDKVARTHRVNYQIIIEGCLLLGIVDFV